MPVTALHTPLSLHDESLVHLNFLHIFALRQSFVNSNPPGQVLHNSGLASQSTKKGQKIELSQNEELMILKNPEIMTG